MQSPTQTASLSQPAEATKDRRRSPAAGTWSLFCFSILALKVFFFAIDPLPKFVMGDSGSYLHSAIAGWIPEDRSYFYGYVIRWTSLWTQSLTSLMVAQLCLSALTSVLVAVISRFTFKLPLKGSYSLGFLCAIDPLHLLWERYVMTETISLCFYALMLYYSLLYLRDQRWRDLALVQVLGVLVIGFRMSFLLVVQINAVLLPLIAFAPDIFRNLRRRRTEPVQFRTAIRGCGGHLFLSVALMLLLHTGYKRANGLLAHQEPAYLYATGRTLLAFWAPILQPEDAADPRLGEIIRKGDEYGLRVFDLRNSQRFAPDGLIDRLSKLEPNPSKADKLAKSTALRALRRNPIGVLGLALENYSLYWNLAAMRNFAAADFSFNNVPGPDLIKVLASRFHLSHENSSNKSFLQGYYVRAWPYYFLLLLAPFFAAATIVLRFHRQHAVLLFIHVALVVAVSVTFGGPAIRYFQPISFTMFLVIALGVDALLTSRRNEKIKAIGSQEGPRNNVASLSGPEQNRTLFPSTNPKHQL